MSATPTEPDSLQAQHWLQLSDYVQQQIKKNSEAHKVQFKETTGNQKHVH